MSPTTVYLQACSLKDEPISSQMQLISLTHSDSCDSLFVTELLVHTNLYIRSSRRWSSLIGGFRTLKRVKIHQITPWFCLVFFLVMTLLFNFVLQWIVLQQWLLPGKNTALECPSYAPCYGIQYDSMAVWEHIRPKPVVGCLPFWGELFLARYHMPEGGMCLLRKDKLLSFMFGKLLLACQRGLYLVLVLFSQQAGKIVMMMRLEIYQGCFPRAEEDMVEVSFEFPALNLAAPIFSGYSTPCSQAQGLQCCSLNWAHLHSFGTSGIPTKLAILIYLVPKILLSLFCWILAVAVAVPAPPVARAVLAAWSTHGPDVLRAEIQRAAATVPIRTLSASHLHRARGLPTIQKAHETEGNVNPDTHCENFTSSIPFPCETTTSGTSRRTGATPRGYLISYSFYLSYFHPKSATGTFTVQQEHLKILFLKGHACGKVSLIYCLY